MVFFILWSECNIRQRRNKIWFAEGKHQRLESDPKKKMEPITVWRFHFFGADDGIWTHTNLFTGTWNQRVCRSATSAY